ncbi:MAG TPA: SUMF1/EgtB/PvdO family nonheme iron enzyme [Chloroflexi bacterium]|nr:SUMF1/EgtB/PvdO family nonheme iron enzyme [Chloroflexota bacterium]
MSKKYALIIGNNQHNDSAWPDLKTPEIDAKSVAEVLQDRQIGGFDQVDIALNASVREMRIAIGKLFNPHHHKPDDILLLYFSGHGELDSNDDLYFVGRETQHEMVYATGLEAIYITRLMDNARSQRQVIILDSCYSGAFGKGGTESAVPTKAIFEGNGEGRYILASSEALQRSWESDATLDEVDHSFFTHFLVEGLRTGAADRDNDGWVHVGELYDHIRDGMTKGSRRQTPIQHALNLDGDLIIARSPVSPFERASEQLTNVIVQAENAAARGDYQRAEALLNSVIQADETNEFLKDTAQVMLNALQVERTRARAYEQVKLLLKKRAIRAAPTAWQSFTKKYPGYDPENLAKRLAPAAKRAKITPAVRKNEDGLLPAPFAWIEIPGKNYSIAKYPLTNAQFAPFIKAGGYKNKKWWTAAGWQMREKEKWREPRYWTDAKWNGPEHPVVGVSWYEAVAYCLWLSEKTSQEIMLPTEDLWQYAAQGDDRREYPWGNEWDCKRCNNSVSPCDSNATTPVRQYEGKNKGDSPFGVVDMAGNVWEWCLTEYESKRNNLDGTNVRVLRGGSWLNGYTGNFRVSARNRYTPDFRLNDGGFRLALSL